MASLHWIGKEAVVNHHREVPYRLLKGDPKLSVGPDGGVGSGNGEVWEARSEGRCRFAMVTERDYQAKVPSILSD